MKFKDSLKITKFKIIITLIFAIVWYGTIGINKIWCDYAYGMEPELTIFNNYSIFSTCSPIESFWALFNEYLLFLIPIMSLYLLYSFIQYKRSK